MKLVFTKAFVFLLTVIILASCNKDNDPMASIVGNWTVSSQAYNLTYYGQPFKDYLISKNGLSESKAQAAVNNVTLDLTTNNNFLGAIYNFKSDNTYSSQITPDGVKHTKFGTWKQSSDGKTLTLTNDSDASDIVTATVTSATSTELQIDLPGGTNTNTPYVVKYTISCTAKRTGEGDAFPQPVMSRRDSLVGSWVIGSYSPETIGSFDPRGRAFIFKDDGTWFDRVQGTTYIGTWRVDPDGKAVTVTEVANGQHVAMYAVVDGLTRSTLKLNFTVYGISLVFSRAP